MKILQLKFKNINSLIGENEIDFTKPFFTNEGLFAITGKTGAGKSSILDAISLALYGKTPRVDVTGKENAVMTRGEKDCYAEIMFEVAGKRWKSSWKQERAKTGTLKAVERVIADENNTIIADKISIKGDKKNIDEKTVNEKIVEILGLSFEQFTKVIMLAQGSFTAFLNANSEEKGILLEQITGTEIYAEISKKVFERNKSEKEKLDKISRELQNIKVLSYQEIQKINEEITSLKNEKIQIYKDLEKIEEARKWLNDLDVLEKQIAEIKLKLPEWELRAINAKKYLEEAEKNWQAVREQQKKQEPIFRQVRELDTKILAKQSTLEPVLKSLSELQENKKNILKTIEDDNSTLKGYERIRDEKKNWADKHSKYKALVSDYVAIENESEAVASLEKELQESQMKIAAMQEGFRLKQADYENAKKISHQKEETLKSKKQELETKQLELKTLIGEEKIAELQVAKEKTAKIVDLIRDTLNLDSQIIENQDNIQNCIDEIKTKQEIQKVLGEKITENKSTAVQLEEKINLLEENLQLLQRIEILEEQRRHLEDGKPCPLCGSEEHPFAKGNTPQVADKEKELSSLKKQHKDLQNNLLEYEKKKAKTEADKENAEKNKEITTKNLSENLKRKDIVLAEIKNIDADIFALIQENKTASILEQRQKELQKIEELIKKTTQIEKQLIELRDKTIPKLQDEKQNAEQIKSAAETNLKVTEQSLHNEQSNTNKLEEKYKTLNEKFLNTLKEYGVESIQELKKCLDAWNENVRQMEYLKSQITLIYADIIINQQGVESQIKSLSIRELEEKNIRQQIQNLLAQRENIFTEKSVDEAEEELKKQLEAAEVQKAKAEHVKNEANTEWEKNKAILGEKQNELSQLKSKKIIEKSTTELQEEFETKKKQNEECSQKIGAYAQQLETNEGNLKTSGSKFKEKEKQETIYKKWSVLYELIGASDGKKYRNFAQALTFEHLIGLANIQLQKMSPRYMLKRVDGNSNPFDLSVIDKFQNNEERTAQNLSGGEKFIVSLSLALGLANMASKNMRIDTMFIDEGFGTLDTDYLDVALNALSNLQNDGKVIGVISHIAELKERIATHIELIPNGNGFSKIRIVH